MTRTFIGLTPTPAARRPSRPRGTRPSPCRPTRCTRRRGRRRRRCRHRPGRGPAVLDHHRADVDRGIEVAVPGEVADRAAVGAALVRLELVDDLHRPHLWRPGERPGRKGRAQHVHRADPLPEPARDLADDVQHVRVGLDDHQLIDRDAAVLADAAEVIAPEVHQHHVLGPLLGIVDEALREAAVLLLAGAARIGARDRPGLDPVAAHLDQGLRRGPGELKVSELEEVHVGRGVDGAQPAVDREGVNRRRCGEALRGHHLECVARRGCSG